MNAPLYKASPRWLTVVSVALSVAVGLVFTTACTANYAYMHNFELIAAGWTGSTPIGSSAISAITFATSIAQFVVGVCLLLVGVILCLLACLLAGPGSAPLDKPLDRE